MRKITQEFGIDESRRPGVGLRDRHFALVLPIDRRSTSSPNHSFQNLPDAKFNYLDRIVF